MSKMYIMNDENLSDLITEKLWPLVEETGRWVGTAAEIETALWAIESPENQDPISIYETDLEMASHSDEATRECFLFGMAFDDQWCKDDVYIIMIHESGRTWVQHC